MALLRQCLEELRLRRGETDMLFEESQPLIASRSIAPVKGMRSGSIARGGSHERSAGNRTADAGMCEENCAAI